VTEGQPPAVQYALFDQNGKSVDETWTKGAPVALNLKTAMKGLSEGLVDQKIGSRVVVLVPSAKAQGTGDRVVVVDILGALPDPPEGKDSPSFGGGGIPSQGDLGKYEPRIYFGQSSPSYSIVGGKDNGSPRELDYPDDEFSGCLRGPAQHLRGQGGPDGHRPRSGRRLGP